MPFTLSHTVAVIPLYKYLGKFGALSALVIGSMIPDFAYLTPFLVDQRMDSHSLLGVYLYCIPVGLTVYFLYHLLMAPVIVSILPKAIQKHLHPDLFRGRLPDIPSYTLIFSIMLGALTHVFWDFFTHHSGIPQHIDWMDTPLTSIDGYDIMPYRILQHFSSLFGLSLLMFWIWSWISKQKANNSGINQGEKIEARWQAPAHYKRLTIMLLIIASSIVGLIGGFANLPETDVMHGMYSAQVFLRYAIVSSAGAFIASSALLGFLYQYRIYKDT